jgi:hypothetical protein
VKSEITEREYKSIIDAMKELRTEMKNGFSDIKEDVKAVNEEVTELKLTQEAHKNSFVTYKQILIIGAWFIGTGLTILGVLMKFLSISGK